MENALHSLISRVEKCMHVKGYTLAIFLDIKGSFNNVHPDAIVRALDSLNMGQNLVSFIHSFILRKSRLVTFTVGATNCQRMVRRGIPQGRILSPLL